MSDSSSSSKAPTSAASAVDPSAVTRAQSSITPFHSPRPSLSFPAAFQPSIIRSFQKDTYYLSHLQTQFSDVVRSVLGSRFLQLNSERVYLIAAVAYYVATTWDGAQTLGEEYVGSRMVAGGERTNGWGMRFVTRRRRTAFVLAYVVGPFVLSRLYARVRCSINTSNSIRLQELRRRQMRWRAMEAHGDEPRTSRTDRLISWLSSVLLPLEDLNKADGWISYAKIIHLTLFYLGGKYYNLAQRVAGVQYISIYPAPPGQKPPSYEVLGVLLAIQLGVKLAISLNHHLHICAAAQKAKTGQEDESSRSAIGDDESTVNIDGRLWTHRKTPAHPLTEAKRSKEEADTLSADYLDLIPPGSRLSLAYASSTGSLLGTDKVDNELLSTAQLRAASVESISLSLLKCTLCMEDRTPEAGTSAVTECGHMFDWGCIMNWLKEKNECPLCRQTVRANRVLPIYNL